VDRHFVRADVEAAIYRGGITTDDLAAVPGSQFDSERAFSRGGGAQDGQDRKRQSYILK
jgi:hypothetical protein